MTNLGIMGDPKSVKINLSTETEDGQDSVSFNARAVYSPPPRELEFLNNASVLR